MITELPEKSHAKGRRGATPRLGFLGVGWIGRNRMEAIAQSGLAEIAAIAEPVPELCAQASKISPEAAVCASIDELLEFPLDGIVIATPSALHAEQAIAAMRAGMNVFCQKPLGRTGAEKAQVVEVARAENKLLGVDLSYRPIDEVRAVTDLVHSGEIGDVFAVDLVFDNAYGRDKAWFYDPKLSGGGCVIDLGIHLVDLGLWALNFPAVENVSSRLYSRGKPISSAAREIEDYAVPSLD